MISDAGAAHEANCPECGRRMHIYDSVVAVDGGTDLPIIYVCDKCGVAVMEFDYYNDAQPFSDCGA